MDGELVGREGVGDGVGRGFGGKGFGCRLVVTWGGKNLVVGVEPKNSSVSPMSVLSKVRTAWKIRK